MAKKLRFAVRDVKRIEELQQDYEPLRKALEEVLETKIEFFPVDNYFLAPNGGCGQANN